MRIGILLFAATTACTTLPRGETSPLTADGVTIDCVRDGWFDTPA